MTDAPPVKPGEFDLPPIPAGPLPPAPTEAPNAQLIVSLAIVAVLGVIAVGLIVAGCITGQWAVLNGGIGTAIGAMATALNAPSGLGSVIAAAKKTTGAPTP